mgnify:CR=1 FL=1
MTVIQYCREKTEVRELVIIRSGGYERCVAYIDCEDLFRLPPDYRFLLRPYQGFGPSRRIRKCSVYLSGYQIGKCAGLIKTRSVHTYGFTGKGFDTEGKF